MEFNLEETLEKIKNHPLFVKLKDIVENIEGFHNHEDIYTHSIKTMLFAIKKRDGSFISNPQAKEKFIQFMDGEVQGIKKSDIAVITALLHDCGKLLSFKENENIHTLNTQKANSENDTTAPGHDYWGGHIVARKILEEVGMEKFLTGHISKLVELHSSLNENSFYEIRKDWPIQDLVSDVKSRAEGKYIEELFNACCDWNDAPGAKLGIQKIIEIFNEPYFYIPREYFIP